MLLKSLEIYGFKSFADRTKFLFDKGVTGVVGPNGCGKSNIVDSIRWVLGEQKTRNLRSDKMENVIFNGTQKRKKANFAEVSLTFENTKNILPTEYTSVKITRKLYRSGESEYQINGVSCRLKDINNLFMDTGIGSDSYAIIELKMVDEILTNKDNERRKFLEEAAGISKYRIRKKQTFKRLEDTDGDLNRVEDLLFEIEKNLRSLERQAKRTRKFLEIKKKYKAISAQYAYLALKSLREQQNLISTKVKKCEDEILQLQSQMMQKEAMLAERKTAQIQQEQTLSEAQADLNQHLRIIQNMETEKQVKQERLKYLQQREVNIKLQLEKEVLQATQNQGRLAELKEKHQQLTQQVATEREREGLAKQELEEFKRQCQSISNERDTYLEDRREAEHLMQQIHREEQVKHVQINSLKNELARMEADSFERSEKLADFSDNEQTIQLEIQSLERQIHEKEALLSQHELTLKEAENHIVEQKEKISKTSRTLDAKKNEHELLRSLVENLEGFPESVKYLKKNANWMKKAPLLSDIFSVPEKFKSAFENFLDPYLTYYVVQNREQALNSIRLLAQHAKGRANFFILDELKDYVASDSINISESRPALSIVEVAPRYEQLAAYLLDRVYVIHRPEDMPDHLPENVVMLSEAGDVLRKKYVLAGGSLGLFEGRRLGRAKNLDQLSKDIQHLQDHIENEETVLAHWEEKKSELTHKNFEKELGPLKKQLIEKQREVSVLESRRQEHQVQLSRVGERTSKLTQDLHQLEESFRALIPQRKLQAERLQQISSQLVEKQDIVQEMNDQLQEKSEEFNKVHIQLIHLINQHETVQRDHQQVLQQMSEFEQLKNKLEDELAQIQEDIALLEQSNQVDEEGMMVLYEKRNEKEQRVDRLEQELAAMKMRIGEVEKGVLSERQQRDSLRMDQESLKDQASDIRMQFHGMKERMEVEFQINIHTLNPEAMFEGDPEEIDVEELGEKVANMRTKIQNYGEINPLAVEAYEEMKERYDFIHVQKEDLLEAKQSLLDTISEIDEKAKEKFLATFDKVRENFQEVFRNLFSSDDKCDLVLLDAENPLESEVSIIARPKGKRPLTIKQLSGGEKTLTAVALLFALYLIKPAPFCIFDEVDAPLDDANIDKFNNIIREFSNDSQFIIVTHNKRTMSKTNVIYGVTMNIAGPNGGVSQVLPVDLEALNLN